MPPPKAAGPDQGGPKQRELLALLLLHINRIVPVRRLVDVLSGPWD